MSNPTPARWRNAVFVMFFTMGFGFAGFVARMPYVRARLGISTDQVGIILMAVSVGSVLGLTTAGFVISRLGSRNALLAVCLLAVGLSIAGLGVQLTSVPVLVAGLFVTGLCTGLSDVSMNLSGAQVERHLGRPIMPIFHAFFSFGTVLGAGYGALGEALELPFLVHVGIVSVLMIGATLGSRPFLGDDSRHADAEHVSSAERLAVWRDPRTWLIGALVLGMALTEGSANDWLALLMVDGHGFSGVGGALAFALFLTAMTAGRLAGVPLLEKYGRVPVLRITAVTASLGLLLVIVVDNQAVALIGTALWGMGASLGFPVGMSAAADDARLAAARVSAVSTIGYLAFLAGPPLLGFLGEAFGLRNAMFAVLAFVLLSALTSGAAREPEKLQPRSTV